MGTNLYMRLNECACCGRYDELHVGKSGPQIQGHPTPPAVFPFPQAIMSWKDWKRAFAEVPHSLYDEYGVHWTDEALITYFEDSSFAARRRQYDQVTQNGWSTAATTWLDDDGFSVSSHVFT